MAAAAADVEVRAFCATDVPAVQALNDAAFPLCYPDTYYSDLLAQQARGEAFSELLVARSNGDADADGPGRVLAEIAVRLRRQPPAWWAWWCALVRGAPAAHVVVAYVCTLAVATDVRRRGYASLLLRRALARAARVPGCARVALHVKRDNEAAVQFYLAHGFHCARRIRKFYRIGDDTLEDALLMRKSLERAAAAAAPATRASWLLELLWRWLQRLCVTCGCPRAVSSLLLRRRRRRRRWWWWSDVLDAANSV